MGVKWREGRWHKIELNQIYQPQTISLNNSSLFCKLFSLIRICSSSWRSNCLCWWRSFSRSYYFNKKYIHHKHVLYYWRQKVRKISIYTPLYPLLTVIMALKHTSCHHHRHCTTYYASDFREKARFQIIYRVVLFHLFLIVQSINCILFPLQQCFLPLRKVIFKTFCFFSNLQ